jgi:hypothetical protein
MIVLYSVVMAALGASFVTPFWLSRYKIKGKNA